MPYSDKTHPSYDDKKKRWDYVPGYEGIYEVSDHGNVRSYWCKNGTGLKDYPHLLSASVNNNGYRIVRLSNGHDVKTHGVARLVATIFVKNAKGKREVNHKNGIKHNDFYKNLEWVTPKENSQHAWDTGLSSALKGENHPNNKLSKNDILDIRAAYNIGCFSYRDISEAYNITKGMVGHIIKRRTWKHI